MIDLERTCRWEARWIGSGAENHINCFVPVLPAPYFRREFEYDGSADSAKIRICGLGYFVLCINGRRVGDRELAPAVSLYDRRTRFLELDILPYLQKGKNAVGVVLGTGWYDDWTHVHWHLDRASWGDYPKMILEILVDGNVVLKSDSSWRATVDGPLRKDGLMTGETYDARKELGDWTLPGYDDSAWRFAEVVPGPGGVLTEETFPGVRMVEKLPAKEISPGVWDVGKILAGRARICVKGASGAQVKMIFSDRLSPDGTLFMDHNRIYCDESDFQTDTYILRGDPAGESWAPDFVWHGFRYIGITLEGEVQIRSVTAEVLSAAADRIGHFSCSNDILNKIFECTVHSYVANFPGFPTDCPHREKLGWTGDAHCAAETGLAMFDMADNYVGWLQTVADCQRPDGALPGIVPTSGWGFNWGNGAFFDYVLPGIVQAVYRFTGDLEMVRKFYPNIKRLLAYYEGIAEDHIISIGLGDWSHFDFSLRAEDSLVLTAYYYKHADVAAWAAELLGEREEAAFYQHLSTLIAESFNRHFYRGNGVFGKGEPTAQALPLFFGLCPEEVIPQAVQRLEESLKAHDYQAYFGIAGGKYMLETLSRFGLTETAYKVATQENVPGWAAWIRDGATALRESWDSQKSHCHIMFGSISFWMMRYLAGLSPELDQPGYRFIRIAPVIPEALTWAKASVRTAYGVVSVAWHKQETGQLAFEIDFPEGVAGVLELPGKDPVPLVSGHRSLEV
ncbi:MAG: family 78 glycoside hydrolase catalytic domain [Lentisphaeria bacterium]|nr:family 78 glycoside hydrolase catalytic domain [Lentisphaeria bacterium]